MLRALLALAALALLPGLQAAPLLFHDHGHGLSFSAAGRGLLAPGEHGLAVYQDGAWSEPSADQGSFSAFAVTERAVYSSGAAQPGRAPRGLLRSTDGGATWQALALAGETDFPILAAGYRSQTLYVLNPGQNAAMPAPGIYVTHDEGKSWRRAAAQGLKGEIHALAAHPRDPALLAAATESGLYLSRDAGDSFRRLDRRQAATAVAFDVDGQRLRYAFPLSGELMEIALDGRQRRAMRLPRLDRDYVTCLAQNPQEGKVLALATRRREVHLSADGGATWRKITPSSETPESEQRAE